MKKNLLHFKVAMKNEPNNMKYKPKQIKVLIGFINMYYSYFISQDYRMYKNIFNLSKVVNIFYLFKQIRMFWHKSGIYCAFTVMEYISEKKEQFFSTFEFKYKMCCTKMNILSENKKANYLCIILR